MIEELLESKRLTKESYQIYQLFYLNEVGHKVFTQMKEEAFMDEPPELSDAAFAFYDGRRSVLRDIQKVINSVNKLLSEAQNG